MYAIGVRLDQPFSETVVQRVQAALQGQGFGVLTTIDMRSAIRDKLGVEMEDYVILGACNPPLAHRALSADRQIGLLLPCNVVVRADGEATVVEAIDPQTMVQISGSDQMAPIAQEAGERLSAALRSLTGPS